MEHKKQAYNLIEDICKINNDVWGNLHGTYDDAQEAAYQIEEALEGFDLSYFNANIQLMADSFVFDTNSPKLIARKLIEATGDETQIPDVDRFDKALDAIYFAIGSMHKLGLAPSQIVEGLQVVHNANLAKSGEKDSQGKVTKPDSFVGPEDQLQLILDKRTN